MTNPLVHTSLSQRTQEAKSKNKNSEEDSRVERCGSFSFVEDAAAADRDQLGVKIFDRLEVLDNKKEITSQ
jgi:hypothetical protein